MAATNHLALYNPPTSNRLIVLAGVFISSVIVGDITPTVDPMRGWIATAIGGGTLEASSSIVKARSSMPTPKGQIYTNNPVATLGASWFNSPPLIGSAKASSPFVHQIPTATKSGSITLFPGEGTVLRTESGDVDQRWNLSIVWDEV